LLKENAPDQFLARMLPKIVIHQGDASFGRRLGLQFQETLKGIVVGTPVICTRGNEHRTHQLLYVRP
jgi:hypothetical protein